MQHSIKIDCIIMFLVKKYEKRTIFQRCKIKQESYCVVDWINNLKSSNVILLS